MRSRADGPAVGAAPALACALFALASCGGDSVPDVAPSLHVLPEGQETVVGAIVGMEGPIAGCALATASIDRAEVRLSYRCPPPDGEVRLLLAHPESAGDTIARTERFVIRSEGAGAPPPALVSELAARLSAREGELRWALARAPGTTGPLERSGGAPQARPATLQAPRAMGFAALGIATGSLIVIVLHRRARRARSRFAAGSAAGLLLGVTALSLGIGYVCSLASVGPLPPRFGGVHAWQPRGHLDAADPSRPGLSYRINARGFRGHEWPLAPESGVVRGVLIGGGRVVGLGLEWEETIAEQLARSLSRDARRVEVVNLGVPGANLRDHVDRHEEAARTLGPSFAVLVVEVPSDLSGWSLEDGLAQASTPSAFSLAEYLLGRAAAIDLIAARPAVLGESAGRELEAQLRRLVTARGSRSPPLFLVLVGSGAEEGRARAEALTRSSPRLEVLTIELGGSDRNSAETIARELASHLGRSELLAPP